MSTSAQKIAVRILVRNNRGQVLMVTPGSRKSRQEPELPGGKVNQDEDLLMAAQRELQEETGLILGVFLLGDAFYRGANGVEWKVYFYTAWQVVSTERVLRPVDGTEIADIGWYDDDSAALKHALSLYRHTLSRNRISSFFELFQPKAR